MATVYLALDLKHDRRVALKVFRPELAASLGAERFLREIKFAARLQHPHILALHDSGEAAGLLYYVMPFVEGETLRGRLKREVQLPIADALSLAREVAEALDHAHRQGILHRDIKPENILLFAGHAVVADFGIARAISTGSAERLTETGLAIGTPVYMSPEQSVGEQELDGRSDVYSLGCVLYEMLAGEPPYTGPTAQAVILRRFTEPVRRLAKVRDAVPGWLDQAVLTALAREPADRFPTARAFAERLAGPGEEARTRGASRTEATEGSVRTIAVLPFANLSPNPDNEYFSDGMTDELINALSKVAGLKVASRTSVFAFKGKGLDVQEIGRRLGVNAILEGSVRQSGSRLRITAQLVNVDDGFQLWGEAYDRAGEDVFAIQDEIARTIAGTLRGRLTAASDASLVEPQTDNIEAYHLYLRGRYFWSRRSHEGFRKAIEYFQQAIHLDPDYALAYSGMADAYSSLGLTLAVGMIAPGDVLPRAISAARKALQINPNLAEAHASLACPQLVYGWDKSGAEAEFRRSIELNPTYGHAHHWYSHCLVAQGRFGESLTQSEKALQLEPLSLVMNAHLGWHYYYARQFDRAILQLRNTLEMDPRWDYAHYYLALSFEQKGEYDSAESSLGDALALQPGSIVLEAELGHVYARAGRAREARAILDRLMETSRHRYVSSFYIARLHEGLGETDKAFAALQRALDERSDLLLNIDVEPRLDALRADPRFATIRKAVRAGAA
jgi:serine/threonine-protein kinase